MDRRLFMLGALATLAAPTIERIIMPSTHTFRDFAAKDQDGTPRFGRRLTASIIGFGRGPGGTVLSMEPRTSTKKRLVPKKKGTTNPLSLIEVSSGTGIGLARLAVQGTDQGHLYNGVRFEKVRYPYLTEVAIRAIPGDSDINPGETFAANFWRCESPAVSDVEVDGARVGASGVGFNSCSGGRTVRTTAHDLRYCKGFALWQHEDSHMFEDVEVLNNAFGFGFERCRGTYVLRRVKFRGSRRADIHLASDVSRARVRIEDPLLEPGQRIKVLLSKTELGKPSLQRREDITVSVNGTPRPDLLQFVTRA